MIKTLRISFSLQNAYRVNAILYSLKQIPLVKRLLPAALYRAEGRRPSRTSCPSCGRFSPRFSGSSSTSPRWFAASGCSTRRLPASEAFLHILLFLTVIGSFVNTKLFDPTKDKYYAMILMRMDARAYTLVNYGYLIAKAAVGFLPFAVWFGAANGLPLWFCLLLPLCIVGMKLFVAGRHAVGL